MKNILSFIASFCGAGIFIGAFYMLCPQGAVSKSVRYVLSLVFILTVITAAGIGIGNLENISFSTPGSEEIKTQDLEISSAKYVYSYLLEKNDIDFNKITVCTDKRSDGSIDIIKVIIYSQCEGEKILNALSEVANNIEVEVVNE